MNTCGILIKGEGFDTVILKENLIEKNDCVNWNNAPVNFKKDFVEKFEEALNMVFETGEITGNEIEIGIDILIILDKMGALVNSENLQNKTFKQIYNEMQIN